MPFSPLVCIALDIQLQISTSRLILSRNIVDDLTYKKCKRKKPATLMWISIKLLMG